MKIGKSLAATLLLLFGCTQRQPAQPAVTSGPYDDASLCACRFICSPDNYQWKLKTVGPTNGGECTCVGKTGVTAGR